MMSLFQIALAAALTASPISIKYEGPLKNALEQIADKGGLNVVVTADLDENVKVNLSDLPPDEALEAIAKIYKLDVKKEGKLWVIRRAEGSATVSADSKPDSLQVKLNGVPVVTLPKIPPLPAMPPLPATSSNDPDTLRDAAEKARDAAEAARDRAEAIREKAQEIAEAQRDKADEVREQAQDLAEAQRDQAEAAREEAEAKAEVLRARAESAKDLVGTGGPVVVKANTTVDSAVAYGGPVVIESNAIVQGNAVAFGGDVVLGPNAKVEGDATSFGGKVVKGPNAVVEGRETAMGGGSFGQAVASKMVREQARAEREEHHGAGIGRAISNFLLSFALFFGLGFLLMMFAPQRMKQLEATVMRSPVKNGFAGLLALFAAVPLTILLAVTLIGIPVAVVMWLLIPVAMLAGIPAVANVIGARLPLGRVRRTQALVLAIGLAVLLLVAQIPVAGGILMLFATLISLGAIIRTRFGQSPRGTPIPETVEHVPA